MTQYIIRRIIQALPLLIVISFTVFLLMNLIPGGPLAAYENNPNITPQDLERRLEKLRALRGLRWDTRQGTMVFVS